MSHNPSETKQHRPEVRKVVVLIFVVGLLVVLYNIMGFLQAKIDSEINARFNCIILVNIDCSL